MSSSTSDFERDLALDASADPRWRRWIALYLAVAVGATGICFLALVLLDPFSTGRLTPIKSFNITTSYRILAHAGRIRNPAFDSAIIGNSRSFPIEPARLSALTGHRIVNLAMPGMYPPEQLFFVETFVRQHRGSAPLIIWQLDVAWCQSEQRHTEYDIPKWVYAESDFEYLRHIVSRTALRAAYARLQILLGLKKDAARLDGYEPWIPDDVPARRAAMLKAPAQTYGEPVSDPFPNLDALKTGLAAIEPASPVVLWFPPVYVGALPVPGSAAEARLAECRARLRAIVAGRPHTELVDLWKDAPGLHDPDNFIDHMHFLDPVARDVERVLAEHIRTLAPRPR
ncbi:MAG: hypothetical protein ACRECO_03675 [Xanthobacteraceae bacterium]